MDVYQKSPLRVLFPRTSGERVEEAVLLNTSGGVAGGDRLETNVTATEDASIAITTQAAEKVYRALGESAQITTNLKVRDAAKLAWLPQETSSSTERGSPEKRRSRLLRVPNCSRWNG